MAFQRLDRFAAPGALTRRVAELERLLPGANLGSVPGLLDREGVTPELLDAAVTIKRAAGQINVVIHTIGILLALPYILEEGEEVASLSLGAGNTGRDHDLERTFVSPSSSSSPGRAAPNPFVRTASSSTSSTFCKTTLVVDGSSTF